MINNEKILGKIAVIVVITIITFCIYEIYRISNIQWIETEAEITESKIEEKRRKTSGNYYEATLIVKYEDESGMKWYGRARKESNQLDKAETNYGVGNKIQVYYNEEKPDIMQTYIETTGYYIIIAIVSGIILYSYIRY